MRAVVHAVDEVDIYVSGWAEEDCVAGSEAAGCVGCRVDEAEVGFDFGDAGGEAFALEVADEEFAEEGSGYGVGGAGVEGSWEEFSGVTGLWGCAHILCGEFLYLRILLLPSSAKARQRSNHLSLLCLVDCLA